MALICQLLPIAGVKTTVNAFGNGVLVFTVFLNQWQQLLIQSELTVATVEVILRDDSSLERNL